MTRVIHYLLRKGPNREGYVQREADARRCYFCGTFIMPELQGDAAPWATRERREWENASRVAGVFNCQEARPVTPPAPDVVLYLVRESPTTPGGYALIWYDRKKYRPEILDHKGIWKRQVPLEHSSLPIDEIVALMVGLPR